jgi:drug/metabolite transporter (DMT)-like permease
VVTLGSAVLHASWNLVVKASRDRLVATWAQVTLAAIVFSPFLAVLGLPDRRVWPYVAVSAGVHLCYALALVAAYERADLSFAYPLARGFAPLPIAAGGVLLLDDRLSAASATGIALTSIGLTWIAVQGGRHRGLEWALVTGALISTYTLVDAAGVRRGDESFRYVIAVFIGNAVLFVPVLLARRGLRTPLSALRKSPWPNLAAGACSLGAYALVLLAARLAPIGQVAAVRETAVVFGALGGWLLLREDLGARRTLGAMAVAAGVAVLAIW